MPIASMFLAVSMNVSPLLVLEPLGEKSSASAPSRRAARPKLRPRARGRLEEEVDDDLALEVVALGRVAYPNAEKVLGGVEQSREFRGREPFETE